VYLQISCNSWEIEWYEGRFPSASFIFTSSDLICFSVFAVGLPAAPAVLEAPKPTASPADRIIEQRIATSADLKPWVVLPSSRGQILDSSISDTRLARRSTDPDRPEQITAFIAKHKALRDDKNLGPRKLAMVAYAITKG
jgi:hypothetical protein